MIDGKSRKSPLATMTSHFARPARAVAASVITEPSPQHHTDRCARPSTPSNPKQSADAEIGSEIIATLCSKESAGGSAQAALRSSTRFHAIGLLLFAAA